MEKFFTPFKVGLLVLAGAGFFYFSFSEVRKDRGGGYIVSAVIEDAAELEKNSAVKIAGINVGEIKDITVDEETGKARLEIRIDDRYRLFDNCEKDGEKLRGAVAAKTSASLLGAYYIELTPGDYRCPPLQDGDRIPNTFQAPTIEDLSTEVKDILPELQAIAENVRVVTESLREATGDDEGRRALKETVLHLENIVAQVDKTVEQERVVLSRIMSNIDTITNDLKGVTQASSGDLKETLENLRVITENVRDFTSGVSGDTTEAISSARSTFEKLDSAVEKLDSTLANAESITKKINEGQGVVGMLINDDTTKESLQGTVEEVGDFAQSLTRMQTLVTFGSEFNGGNAATNLSSGFRSYLGLRLQPKPDKFYEIEITDDPRGVEEFVREEESLPGGGVAVTETRTLRDAFKFSLQMGLRWKALTFRFGVRDNTGGLGLDFNLGRFQIKNDFFEFPIGLFDLELDNIAPRWRLSLFSPLPLRGFYFVGGIDDILNSPSVLRGVHQRTWFFGLQYRFDDQDLKSLLTVAPVPSL